MNVIGNGQKEKKKWQLKRQRKRHRIPRESQERRIVGQKQLSNRVGESKEIDKKNEDDEPAESDKFEGDFLANKKHGIGNISWNRKERTIMVSTSFRSGRIRFYHNKKEPKLDI